MHPDTEKTSDAPLSVPLPSAPLRSDALLRAYDRELRTDAETPSALSARVLGSIRLVTFAGGRGFVTYPRFDSASGYGLAEAVSPALEHFRDNPHVTRVEWKTRGHDHAPRLHETLLDSGFAQGETESIMLGDAALLATKVPLPRGVILRQITSEADVRAMSAMQDEAFGDTVSDDMADALLRRLSLGDGMQLWIAECEGQIISAGRLEPVRGSRFAGLWGGATREAWRGRGVYRALTAARAQSALAMGKTLIHSDSTPFSRPILERSGLIAASTTTPYRWRR